MSEVVLNRIGVDHVNFNITTSGDSVATCSLKNKLLLDPNLEYLVRVSELNGPMSGLPLFGFNPDGSTAINEELFRIKRRVWGTAEAAFLAGFETTQYTGFGGNYQAFSSSVRTTAPGGAPHFSATGFISDLGKSANNFSQNQDLMGAFPDGVNYFLDPTAQAPGTAGIPRSNSDYLWIRLNADGCVEFIGTSLFWNNFVIQFSTYGKTLLGIHPDFLDDHDCSRLQRRGKHSTQYV